jgi:signal transduction histidine kinase
MNSLRSFLFFLRDLPVRQKLALLVGILVVNIVTVISLAVLGLGVLSSVRAYVGGEGLWAKAQKDAIYSLSRYAVSLSERDYLDYLSHLKVPLGDRKARLALGQADPDLAAADAGFLEGGNHPEDVRGMSQLFLRFHHFGPIRRAIGIWTQADAVLLELQGLGEAFHTAASRRRPTPAEVSAFITELERVNLRLTGLEDAFSAAMGEAARAAKSLLVWAMVACSLGVGCLSLLLALWVSRGIADGVTRISEAARRAAQGDLDARVEVASQDELGRLAAAFNAMIEGLARIDRLKGEFVANVSHELRTPLTLNLAPLESLLDGDYGPVPERQRQALGVMRNNLLRLLQLVNGLLDFSKIEAGEMRVQREPTDIEALTRSVLRDFQPALEAKGLRLQEDLDVADTVVEMDRHLYERILFNLLSNAVKFTPQGGTVTLRLQVGDGRLGLALSDTGIGISAEDLKGLFKKFRQAEASSTRRFEGTGLGLALVKECAQLLGGGVEAESSPGLGSTFRVHCAAPRSTARARAEGPGSASRPVLPVPVTPVLTGAAEDPPGRRRVLVAEDNPELAAYIKDLLGDSCQVRICADGLQALEALRSWKPDLLLSDIMMPGMDGLALTREAKRSAETGQIPVVLLTALTDRESLVRGWEAGADDYLFKPFHPKELQARVRTLLSLVAWRQRSELHRQRQEIVSQFARIASHDLKAPLRTMAGYASLLQREAGGRLDPESRAHLQVIVDSAARMHGMIESLVRYAHLAPGDDGFRPCDLNQVVSNVAELLGPALSEAGAELDLGPLPTLSAVPEQAFALFQNLFDNSLKYRHPGRNLRITVRAEARGPDWLFSVTDNGRGFDPSQGEAAFELFRRLRSDGAEPGDGMGLAIAKKIVESHHGRIWADPRPGEGVSFYFILPAERVAAKEVP